MEFSEATCEGIIGDSRRLRFQVACWTVHLEETECPGRCCNAVEAFQVGKNASYPRMLCGEDQAFTLAGVQILFHLRERLSSCAEENWQCLRRYGCRQ